jgi:hypothetical protein
MVLARWSFLFSNFFAKKRGERRTGSSAVGRAALGLFSAIFFTVGMVSLAFILLKLSIPEWRVNHQFVETDCKILFAQVVTDDAGKQRPEFQVEYTADGHAAQVWARYDIAGAFQSAEAVDKLLAQFPPDAECDCWYDPRNPQTVVLARGYSISAWLMPLLPAAFIFLGGGGLIFAILTWGKSTERIAATTPSTSGLDLILPATTGSSPTFPTVPDFQDLNDSPGTFLRYRLTPGSSDWTTAAMGVMCVLWNVALVVFGRMAVLSFQRGERDWWLVVFVVLLFAVGIFSLVLFLRRLLITTSVGPTLVEISAHPLVPGGAYEVYVSQAGRVAVAKLSVSLVCEEVAVYRQGTNTRKTTRRVFAQPLVTRESFKIGQGVPFEARTRLQIPHDAMHSFTSAHNRIDWKLVVAAEVARWPDFERGFPVVIRPRQSQGATA